MVSPFVQHFPGGLNGTAAMDTAGASTAFPTISPAAGQALGYLTCAPRPHGCCASYGLTWA